MDGNEPLIRAERARRIELWDEFHRRGGPDGVEPRVIRDLRLHGGQHGVFRDLELTRSLTTSGRGVAVGLLYTGLSYADDLFDDGLIYHYPVTSRGQRDRNEVAAMKACAEHSLPVFVVITPSRRATTRDVRLGWVSGYDDETGQFLISFGGAEPSSLGDDDDSRAFELRMSRSSRRSQVRLRSGQGRFRFAVTRRYGNVCAFCSISEPKLLEAAHLCPVEQNGSDDPRNGLIMCLTHHKAFDAGLLRVDPESRTLHGGSGVVDLRSIGVTVSSLDHLRRQPHPEALRWAWSRWEHGDRRPRTRAGILWFDRRRRAT